MKVWLNDGLVDEADARVSVVDHGFTVGDGVFETFRTYGSRPFAVDRHLERLAASAAAMGLAVPPAAVVREALAAVVAANGAEDGALRVTVTSGPGPMGSGRGGGGPTLVVTTSPLPAWPAAAAVAVAPWPRNERAALAAVKTTSYAENVVALAWARERGAEEALFVNLAGLLCEGTGSNLFVVVAGRLLTPPLSAGCLAGVTRAVVLESIGAIEGDLTVDDLVTADEAFLTSSTREVQAIGTVDGRPLPAAPGPVTTAAAEAFAAAVASALSRK
ncbi:MAG TPA: aminotransferase class IV [Acidimicrobiales bacterium]|nr:aminotransferase class IV [Acidimicrobiales bacterium]